MRNSERRSRLYILTLMALILAMTVGIHRAILAAATATATQTAEPVGTLHPTLTSSPTVTPSASIGPAARSTRTPRPSATPLDTPTSTALVKAVPTVVQQGPLLAQEITLAAYGVRPLDTISSTGSVRFTFSLPNNWVPDGNNFLNLNVEYSKTSGSATNAGTVQNSVLQVRFDNELAASVTLTPDAVGSRNIIVPLRIGLLGIQARRTHVILITLDTRTVCLANFDTRISIREDLSFFHFEYREGTPVRDLASYPQPFYNNPVAPQVDTVLFVLPANYTVDDLQAASAMAARLGRATNNGLQIHVTTADSLRDQDQQNFNMIAIGQLGTNALIDSLYAAKALPTTLEADGSLTVNKKPIADTDGIVQIIANPKNALRSILVVTGKTREALTKAAGAMAGPQSVLKLGGALALISDLHLTVVEPPAVHISFASLGYPDVTLTAFNSPSTEYQFVAPLGMALTSGAYVDIDYDLADTLRTAQSTITMTMNGAPVDSITVGSINPAALPTLSAVSGQHLRVSIPPNSVKGGATNIFSIRLDVQGDWKCNPPSDAATWFLIRSSSEFYLPYRQADSVALRPSLDKLPSPFTVMPDLSDVLITLPEKPTLDELEQMARVAGYLGGEANDGARYAPRVALGQPGTAFDRSAYHFIVIGRVSNNPFLAQLNDSNLLPQPFEKTDELKQVLDSVVYRLPTGYNIGVLQVIQSPWSAKHAILVITGTSAVGQGLAASVLLDGKYSPSDLEGNLVFVNSSTISVVDTTAQQAGPADTSTSQISLTATSTASATSVPESPTTAQPTLPVYTVTPYPTSTPFPTNVQW
ncbi:MAG: cellulose biosynthesis cyclic di-GMP-binding regulatory protein BcsB [Aggregatilineales bacterium]